VAALGSLRGRAGRCDEAIERAGGHSFEMTPVVVNRDFHGAAIDGQRAT
jgi:hypothetical protein